jgi:hypothetical protein
MKLDVKAKDDDGNIVFEGKLDKAEISFLIQYAINDLMAAGVQFRMEQDEDEDDTQLKFDYEGTLN